jgi:hypothetical protein
MYLFDGVIQIIKHIINSLYNSTIRPPFESRLTASPRGGRFATAPGAHPYSRGWLPDLVGSWHNREAPRPRDLRPVATALPMLGTGRRRKARWPC